MKVVTILTFQNFVGIFKNVVNAVVLGHIFFKEGLKLIYMLFFQDSMFGFRHFQLGYTSKTKLYEHLVLRPKLSRKV